MRTPSGSRGAPGVRMLGISKGWLYGGAIALVIVALAATGLFVVYPRVGASMVRSKVGGVLAERLGRQVRFGEIDIALGSATLRDLEIRGPLDGDVPLVHVKRIDVAFAAWPSLVGTIELGPATLDGVFVAIRRGADGADNVYDVIERLRAAPDTPSSPSDGPRRRPTSITVAHAKLLVNDELTGATGLVADATATWTPERITAQARGVTATTLNAPKASFATIDIEKLPGLAPIVSVDGGELSLYPRLALSGITGKVVADPRRAGEYIIDLAGGYGGVPGRLWTAKGAFDPKGMTGWVDIEAEKFQLARLAPILEHSAVVDYAETSVDTRLHIDADRAGARFAGTLQLKGLNVGHPLIAEKEVHGLDLSANIAGSFVRDGKKLELTKGDFVVRNLPFSITGVIAAPPMPPAAQESPPAALEPPRKGPLGIRQLDLHVVVPKVKCQRAFDAVPVEMAPHMAGYKAKGTFDADIKVAIDWNDLDATVLSTHVGIDNCKITDEPKDSPKRLEEEFEHFVEVDQGEWLSFDVGPSNNEFVPLAEISPYLIKSIMTTEDNAFYDHHGFITSEFRTALVNNLKAGRFMQGASSITMQMVKNVLLYRDKTLARKLQELFLTWHVENTLTKDRILEIYFNVIEYGPGLYGIGPAAYHYFGKKPKDLTPMEAAFFSTILPAPKDRYRQYCAGTLTRWTTGKIDNILKLMLKRERLTQAEYDAAVATPLVFSKDGMESEDDCMKRVKDAIKNARPTNPLAEKPKDKATKKPTAKKKRERRKRDDKPPI